MDSKKLSGLKELVLFQLLGVQELKEVAKVFKEKRYSAGATIFSENEAGDSLCVINYGTVKISKQSGHEVKELITLYSGDFFGEIALFECIPRTASAMALEDTSVLEIHRDEFVQLISKKPRLGIKILYRIIQGMGKRLQRLNVQGDDIFI